MEKQIVTAERYKVSEEYYMDVREEVAGTGERDYWLCSRSRDGKIFMCTKRYRDRDRKKHFFQIKFQLISGVMKAQCSRRWQPYTEMYVAIAIYGGED